MGYFGKESRSQSSILLNSSVRVALEEFFKMSLPIMFQHPNGFIHESVSVLPCLKYPNTNRVFAVINGLQFIINLTNFLWDLCFDTNHVVSSLPPESSGRFVGDIVEDGIDSREIEQRLLQSAQEFPVQPGELCSHHVFGTDRSEDEAVS